VSFLETIQDLDLPKEKLPVDAVLLEASHEPTVSKLVSDHRLQERCELRWIRSLQDVLLRTILVTAHVETPSYL
jgi:hypothetical protein